MDDLVTSILRLAVQAGIEGKHNAAKDLIRVAGRVNESIGGDGHAVDIGDDDRYLQRGERLATRLGIKIPEPQLRCFPYGKSVSQPSQLVRQWEC